MNVEVSQAAPHPGASRWIVDWLMVATATLGVALSTVGAYSVGKFVAPLEAMYGWSRTQTRAGVSVSSFTLFALAGFSTTSTCAGS